MGNYTALKVKAKLSAFGESVVRKLMTGDLWENIAAAYPDKLFLAQWAKVPRSCCIPFGSGWEDGSSEIIDGRWEFVCSLKNYNYEIESFLDDVLPYLISEPAAAWRKNECQEDWEHWNPLPLVLALTWDQGNE